MKKYNAGKLNSFKLHERKDLDPEEALKSMKLEKEMEKETNNKKFS